MHLKLAPSERAELLQAADRIKKVAEAAAKACAKAGCNDSECLTQAGYGEEAKTFLERYEPEKGVTLSRGHCVAVSCGLQLRMTELARIDETLEGGFLVESPDVDDKLNELRKLFQRIKLDVSDQMDIEEPDAYAAEASPGEEAQCTVEVSGDGPLADAIEQKFEESGFKVKPRKRLTHRKAQPKQ